LIAVYAFSMGLVLQPVYLVGYEIIKSEAEKVFKLWKAQTMSNISKDTLFYRLKHMSIKEATKNPGE
jgi:type IV secretory pathway VirB3-like protein